MSRLLNEYLVVAIILAMLYGLAASQINNGPAYSLDTGSQE